MQISEVSFEKKFFSESNISDWQIYKKPVDILLGVVDANVLKINKYTFLLMPVAFC